MLLIGSRLIGTPVMSLQTGTKLGTLSQAIIDPATLGVVAYELDGPLLTERPAFLRTADIREYSKIGMIIDSADEIIGNDDIIKQKHLFEQRFTPVGMQVIDDRGQKLGKVEDYTLDTLPFVIQQLSVKHGFFKSLSDTGKLIHRSQIIEINDTAIIVKSPTVTAIEPVMQSIRSDFVNPFRKPSSQVEPETIESN